MKMKNTSQSNAGDLPVSKQTAGGVAGAILGGVVGGPIGAVAGAIAGTVMGNRAAKGQSLVSSSTVQKAKDAVKAVKDKLPARLGGARSKVAKLAKPAKAAVKKVVKKVVKKALPKLAAKSKAPAKKAAAKPNAAKRRK